MTPETAIYGRQGQKKLGTLYIRRRRLTHSASVLAMSLITSTPACFVSAFVNVVYKSPSHMLVPFKGSKSSRENAHCLSASNGINKILGSSDRKKRDEYHHRKKRKDDVEIGKTSAKRDAIDYPIDPKATEREYLLKASKEERLIHKYTDDGIDAMKALRLDLANQYFDKVFELRPQAYLWQAGIVKFYLHDIKGAADVFARNAMYFEKKFGPMGMGPASEERIWRNAAELKYFTSLEKSRQKQFFLDKQEGNSPIAQIQENESNDGDNTIGFENRKVYRLARELFDASTNQQRSAEVVSRAKLVSLAGKNRKSAASNAAGILQDIKKHKLNASYFLALHYDVTGDNEESKKWMKTAFKLCSNAGKSSDIMDTLPLLHMTARDWFDDDPYDEDERDFGKNTFCMNSPKYYSSIKTDGSILEEGKISANEHMSNAYSDPILEASIMADVGKMKFLELRKALRIRGISATGSKEKLKERLFISLMNDAGYHS